MALLTTQVPACHGVDSFNIAATSGLYSTVAGVMAGFAFAALFYLATTYPPGGDKKRNAERDRYDLAAQAMSAAFLALLLSSVAWAIVAGETTTASRASSIEVFAGCGFALATVQLFYSILLLVKVTNEPSVRMQHFFMLAGGAFLCPMAFFLALLGVTDYEKTGPSHENDHLLVGGCILALILVVLVAVLRLRAWADDHDRPNGLPRILGWLDPSWITVLIGAAALLGTSAMDGFAGHCTAAQPGVIVFALIVTWLTLVNLVLRFFLTPTALA